MLWHWMNNVPVFEGSQCLHLWSQAVQHCGLLEYWDYSPSATVSHPRGLESWTLECIGNVMMRILYLEGVEIVISGSSFQKQWWQKLLQNFISHHAWHKQNNVVIFWTAKNLTNHLLGYYGEVVFTIFCYYIRCQYYAGMCLLLGVFQLAFFSESRQEVIPEMLSEFVQILCMW